MRNSASTRPGPTRSHAGSSGPAGRASSLIYSGQAEAHNERRVEPQAVSAARVMPTRTNNVEGRRLLSFSLRGLMLLFVVVSIPLAIIAQRAQRQKAAVQVLREAGAGVFYDYQVVAKDDIVKGTINEGAAPPGPSWLRSLLGIDYVARVVWVDLRRTEKSQRDVGGTVDWRSVFASLSELTDLRRLQIGSCDADTAEFAPLANLGRLERFDLSGRSIDDDALTILQGMSRLKWLNLSYTNVVGQGLAHLRSARSLETLFLKGCPLEDRAIAFSLELPSLKRLDLSGTPLTGHGLAGFLSCQRLERLNLTELPLDERAFDHLSQLTQLHELNLSDTSADDALLSRLAPLRELRRIDLSRTLLTDSGLATVARWRRLESLSLDGTLVSGQGLVHLRELTHLTELNLSSTLIDDDGLAHLARLRSIERLLLERNAVTIAGVAQVASMPALQSIAISVVDNVGICGVVAVLWDDGENRIRQLMTKELAFARAPTDRQAIVARVELIAQALREDVGIGIRAKSNERLCDQLATRLESSSAEAIAVVGSLLERDLDSGDSNQRENEEERSWRGPVIVEGRSSRRFRGFFHDFCGIRVKISALQKAMTRRRFGLEPAFVNSAHPAAPAISLTERRQLFARLARGRPHEELLRELVDWRHEPTAIAALGLAAHPDSTTWCELLDAAPSSLAPRILATWRESEPANAAAWYCGNPDDFVAHARRYSERETLNSVGRGNACDSLIFRPRSPWPDDGLLAEANAILHAAGRPTTRWQRRNWSNPWQWHGAWNGADMRMHHLALIEEADLEAERLEEAARCTWAAETMATRFIIAQPRELGTVLQGCRMLVDLHGARDEESEQFPAIDALRNGLRRTACFRLARSLTNLSFAAEFGPPIDKSAMSAWMGGLATCTDPRAIAMNRTIDDWARLDDRIVHSDVKELQSIYQEMWQEPAPLDEDGLPELRGLREEPDVTTLDPYVEGSE